ncbi:MAG: 2-phosphosulfolactate phosphatase [Dehalococcoidia bacterium]
MPTLVDVALTPGAIRAGSTFIVVDLLRATTTIAVLFSQGLGRLTVTETIEEARALARDRPSALLMGEEAGLPPAGFGLGNSPLEAAEISFEGGEAVMATTNGSRAICAAAARGPTLTGALANRNAVCAAVAPAPEITIVCSGNEAGAVMALEDVCAAGALVATLRSTDPTLDFTDGALLAEAVWHRSGPALAATSAHARHLRSLGFAADIEYAIQPDTAPVTPAVVEHGRGWAVLET